MFEQAIAARQILAFNYDGAPRLVMPHAYGETAKGKLVLRGFQIMGESTTSQELGWKLFSCDKINDLKNTYQTFNDNAEGYKPGDKQIAKILAEQPEHIDLNALCDGLNAALALMNTDDPEELIPVIAAQLRQAGARNVTVNFSGGGDSGAIDDITIDGRFLSRQFNELLQCWADRFLEGVGVDWYNNEGGYGSITFDLVEGKFSHEVYCYERTSTLEESSEVDI